MEHAHGQGDRNRRLPEAPFARQELSNDAPWGLAHSNGGFCHDDRFRDPDEFVDHYQGVLGQNLLIESKLLYLLIYARPPGGLSG